MAIVRTRSYRRTRLRPESLPPRRSVTVGLLEPVSVDFTVVLEAGAELLVDRTVAIESVGGLTPVQADRVGALEARGGIAANRTLALEARATVPAPGELPVLDARVSFVREVADTLRLTAVLD